MWLLPLFIVLPIVFSDYIIRREKKVLVILDDWNLQKENSEFIDQFKALGYEVNVEMASNENLEFSEYDEFLYEVIVMMAPSTSFLGGSLTHEIILSFFDAGGTLLIFGDTDAAHTTRKLVNAFGLEFMEQGYRLYQKYKAEGQDATREFCVTSNAIQNSPILSTNKNFHFKGLGMVTQHNNTLIRSVLRGHKSCYAQNELASAKRHVNRGEKMLLVGALQGLNNARSMISGSISMCSNKVYKEYPANKQFCEDLMRWTLNMTGRLRYSQITHYTIHDRVLNASVTPGSKPKGTQEDVYKKFDTLYFSVDMEEFDSVKQQWNPYVYDQLQLEYVMLDPYYRIFLTRVGKTATYEAVFQVPDQHGTFKFRLDHQRTGYSWIHFEDIAPVRHLKHTEQERFIVPAYPYYAVVTASFISFLIFVHVFYLHADPKLKQQ